MYIVYCIICLPHLLVSSGIAVEEFDGGTHHLRHLRSRNVLLGSGFCKSEVYLWWGHRVILLHFAVAFVLWSTWASCNQKCQQPQPQGSPTPQNHRETTSSNSEKEPWHDMSLWSTYCNIPWTDASIKYSGQVNLWDTAFVQVASPVCCN